MNQPYFGRRPPKPKIPMLLTDGYCKEGNEVKLEFYKDPSDSLGQYISLEKQNDDWERVYPEKIVFSEGYNSENYYVYGPEQDNPHYEEEMRKYNEAKLKYEKELEEYEKWSKKLEQEKILAEKKKEYEIYRKLKKIYEEENGN